MPDNQDLDTAPDAADGSAAPTPPTSNDAPPTDDPYGLRGLTFADLPNQPGDGVFGGVMRHMAAMGHPDLQEWAANDAAMRAGAGPQPQSQWYFDATTQAPPAQPPASGSAVNTYNAPDEDDDQGDNNVPGQTTSGPMTLSPDGEAFIKQHEGWHGLGKDSVEHGSQTAFWGHKVQAGEDTSKMDADATFQADKARAEGLVRQATGGVPLTQSQFDGLVSFAYNSPAAFKQGPDNLFQRLLSKGSIPDAANRMLLWNKADNGSGGKVVVPGLTNRRNAERNLILTGNYGENQ